MHVIVLADAIATQRAGIHHYGVSLLNHLLEHYPNHDFTLITPSNLDHLDVAQILVPIKSIPAHQRIRQFVDIPKVVNRLKPDAVIELAHFGPFCLRQKTKRLTVVHDLTPITHPQFHSRASSLAHQLLLPRVISKSDRIIVNSTSTARSIQKRWPTTKEKIRVYYPTNSPSESLPPSTLPPPYHPYFLTVGSLEPRKNLVTILDGFERYCQQSKVAAQLHIVGGDEWKNHAFKRRLAISPYKDRVILHGHVPRQDLMLLYEHCIGYVSASWAEGFGLPVLEAMKVGRPLLLSKIDSYQEIAGPASWSFSPNDASTLAAKMLRLAENKQDSLLLAQQSRHQMQKFLDMRETLPGVLDAL